MIVMNFWTKNKVFILGALSAIAITLQQFTEPHPNYSAVGYAVFLAVLSYFAKNWRGQTTSLVGILATAAVTIVTGLKDNEAISVLQVVGQALAAFIATQSPDKKSVGYEQTPVIKQAKEEGKLSPGSTSNI